MKNEIIKYIVTTFLGAVIASLIAYIKLLKEKAKLKIQENKAEDEAIRKAIKILLRAEIKDSCKYYIDKGSMTATEYDELCEEIEVYETFKGDGLIHKLFEMVKEQVEII